MRILHILHQYLPDHTGGVEHYARSVASALGQRGHEQALFCRRSGRGTAFEQEKAGSVTLYRATAGPFTPLGRFRSTLADPFLAGALRRVVTSFQPDLIHIHHLMGLPVGALARLVQGIPLLVTLHDYWWVCPNAMLYTDYGHRVCPGPRAWLNCARCGLARAGAPALWPLAPLLAPAFAARAGFIRRLAAQVRAWIAPTRFVATWHVARGYAQDRVHVVPHGIELPPAGLVETQSRARQGSRSLEVAYVGGLAHHKGVHVLIDALNTLPPSIRLTIAGDTTAFPDYCADLQRRAQHPGIRFVGRLERADVWQLLARSDVLVVPSLWYETASLVVQEAFAVGTPVIASNHGALAERVQDQVDGLLVPPGDVQALAAALQRLSEDPALLARLRAGIRRPIDVASHADELEKIYAELLREGP